MNKNSKEFKDLQAEWDSKLKSSGFADIEERHPDRLKAWSHKFHNKTQTERQAKEEYYRAAGQFFYEHTFANAVDRRIWELHSQGTARLRIVEILRQEKLWYWEQVDTIGRTRRKDSRPCSFGVQEATKRLAKLMIRKIEDERAANNSEE